MKNIIFLAVALMSINSFCDNADLPLSLDKEGSYNGNVSCDELIEEIFQRKWDLGHRPSLFKDDIVPKCLNDQFPEKWIETKEEINRFGFTICDKPPCTIYQFPLMGSAAGNDVGSINGRNKILLRNKFKTIEGVGFYEREYPWYREWYSFNFKDETYYISAVSITFK